VNVTDNKSNSYETSINRNVTDNKLVTLTQSINRNGRTIRCRTCKCDIAPGVDAYQTWWHYGMSGTYGYSKGYSCKDCADKQQRDNPRQYDRTRKCQYCCRVVHLLERSEQGRSDRFWCSHDCEWSEAAAIAKQRRHLQRATVECETCSRQFVQVRTDSRFCSGACRQKAYRRRQQGARPGANLRST
jgi:hypothetical protein